jgi:predicted enzyme related to lactoylglutathione lyase
MKVTEIAFVGYPVTDLARARRFYEQTLGLTTSRVFGDATGWIEYDIGPTTIAITNAAPDWKPSPGGGCVALEVDDFKAAIARLKAERTPFKAEPFETPACHMAVASDPDGNSITIHKRKS